MESTNIKQLLAIMYLSVAITQMIAPIRVGDGALVAAGTTVTEDVPRHHKAKSRVPQVNRPMNKAKK